MRHVVATAACASIMLALLLAACDRKPPGMLRADDPKVVAQGRVVYQARCAVCHGAQLEGQPNWRERDAGGRLPAPPHDASGHTWHHSDDVLFRIVKYGAARGANIPNYPSNMPAFEGVLSDEEIVAVLSWIKSRWPPRIRQQQEEVTAANPSQG